MYTCTCNQTNKAISYKFIGPTLLSKYLYFILLFLPCLFFGKLCHPVWCGCYVWSPYIKKKIVIFHVGYRLCLLIHIHQFTMIWENLVLGNNFSCFKPHTTTQKCFQYSLVGSRDHSSLDICIIAFNQHVDSHYSNWYLNS